MVGLYVSCVGQTSTAYFYFYFSRQLCLPVQVSELFSFHLFHSQYIKKANHNTLFISNNNHNNKYPFLSMFVLCVKYSISISSIVNVLFFFYLFNYKSRYSGHTILVALLSVLLLLLDINSLKYLNIFNVYS